MSSGTNQERIEQNNLKIDDLITQANELPDMPDIEPIYGSADIEFLDTKISIGSNAIITSYLDGYFTCRISNSIRLYKFNEGKVQQLLNITQNNINYFRAFILDVTPDYVYFVFDYSTSSTYRLYDYNIYRYNIQTEDYELYHTLTYWGAYTSYYNTGFYKRRTVFIDNGYIEFDIENKKISLAKIHSNQNAYGYHIKENLMLSSNSSNPSIYFLDDNTVHTYSNGQYVSFIDLLEKTISINNNLYKLNADYSLGEKLKSTFIPTSEYGSNYTSNGNFINPAGDIYIYKNYIYKLNRETYTLEKLFTLPNEFKNYGGGWCFYYNDTASQTIKIINITETTDVVIGYKYNGHIFYNDTPSAIQIDKVLNGYKIYDGTMTQMTGTMPNNGQLNYTPSTSQQTIPAGYTSGGTIAAVSMTEQEIEQAETQISNLFGEEVDG